MSTPLHLAIRHGHAKMVALLISLKANVNAVDMVSIHNDIYNGHSMVWTKPAVSCVVYIPAYALSMLNLVNF